MTKRVHEIGFPNYYADVSRGKRTVAHMPIIDALGDFAVGDELRLLAAPNFPRCIVATLIAADRVRLLAAVDADLDALHVTRREEYLARWDALHPDLPSRDDPEVWRIAWRYETALVPDPPEWCLAV